MTRYCDSTLQLTGRLLYIGKIYCSVALTAAEVVFLVHFCLAPPLRVSLTGLLQQHVTSYSCAYPEVAMVVRCLSHLAVHRTGGDEAAVEAAAVDHGYVRHVPPEVPGHLTRAQVKQLHRASGAPAHLCRCVVRA